MDTLKPAALAEWMPIRISRDFEVDWCWWGDTRFTDPFFDETVEHALRNPYNLLFRQQTSMEDLLRVAQEQPGLQPDGFIFHISRCGSTLLSRMLAALPRHIVLSEPGPVDAILRGILDGRIPDEDQLAAWLRGVIGALGRPLHGEQKLFVKFDAWHILLFPLVRRAFPTVPWFFLYRDPVEVIASHDRQVGMQMMPGLIDPALTDIQRDEAFWITREEYGARILARLFQGGLQYLDQLGRLVNYRELGEGFIPVLQQHFSLEFTPGDLQQMKDRIHFHAKRPDLPFMDDSVAKQHEVSDLARQMAQQWAEPAYRLLEDLRLKNAANQNVTVDKP